MVGVGIAAMVRVRDHDLRPDLADDRDDLGCGLVSIQGCHAAVGPVQPAQICDTKSLAATLELARAHLAKILPRGAVLRWRKDLGGLTARGADQCHLDTRLGIARERAADA